MKTHSIWQHPVSGIFYATIQRDGVRRRFPLGRSEREARKELKTVEADIASGRIGFAAASTTVVIRPDNTKDIHIKELAVKYWEWLKDNRSMATAEMRGLYLRRFLAFAGDKMVSEITSETINGFFVAEKKHHGLGPNAGNHALIQVKSMYGWARKYDVCSIPIARFPEMTHEQPETKRFSHEEFARLLAKVPKDFKDLILFGLLTGLRPQELRQLQTMHILKLENGSCCIRIEKHKTARSTKNPKPRSVPLCETAKEIVVRQMASHSKSPFVFLDGSRHPYTACTFRNRLKRWCRRAGVEEKPPYALRHGFGTIQGGENNLNPFLLAQLMGHVRLETTNRYVGLVSEAHLRAVNAMEEKVLGSLKTPAS